MAKKSIDDAIQAYNSGGGSIEYFSLRQDKESATVRMLYRNSDDLEVYTVHEAQVNGKDRWIDCPETEDCPLCQIGNRARPRIFIQLIDDRDGKLKLWERGRDDMIKVDALAKRYGSLFNRKIEIERHGKPRDTSTNYMFYVLDQDDTKFEDLPERMKLVGPDKYVLVKTYEELRIIARNNSGAVEEQITPRTDRQPETF